MLLPGRQCAPLVGVQELAKDSVVGVNLGCLRTPANTTSVSEKSVEHGGLVLAALPHVGALTCSWLPPAHVLRA